MCISRRFRLVALVAAFVFIVGLPMLSGPIARAGVGVTPDPFAAQYVVSGAVLIDQSFSGDPNRRQWAVTCGACEWVYTAPCLTSAPTGITQLCGLHGPICPVGSTYLRVWFRDSAAMAWDPIGLVCSSTLTPTPVAAVRAALSIRQVPVPPLRPTSQPSGRSFTGLPVWFASRQPVRLQRRVTVLGWNVVLTAAPRWQWTFGDGAVLTTTDPGARYPAGSVRHTYRKVARAAVQVVAVWHAEWQAQDLAPQPVADSLTQVRGLPIDVRPARTILVPTQLP